MIQIFKYTNRPRVLPGECSASPADTSHGMVWIPAKSSAKTQGEVNGWKSVFEGLAASLWDINNMTIVIIHFKKSIPLFLQAVVQKSWAGWRDRAGIRRNPDGVWCGFLWLFPWSPGMSSSEPALGYLTRRAGQKKRFKVTTKSMVWHSLSWCKVVLFCFAFITFCKGTDFITCTMLYLTCARKHGKKLLLKVLTNPEDQLHGEVFCEAKRLFLKRAIENSVFST